MFRIRLTDLARRTGVFGLLLIICSSGSAQQKATGDGEQLPLVDGSCGSPTGPFFEWDGSSYSNYTQANTAGKCNNNLTAGQTYCYTFLYPSTGSLNLKIYVNGSCGNCDGSFSINSDPACTGGCWGPFSSFSGCTNTLYNSSCSLQESGGFEMGTGCTPAITCNTTFTWCFTVPAGCSTLDICPLSNCSAGSSNCAGGLPVKLMNTLIEEHGEKIFMAWVTGTEENNDYFTVEKSDDGIHYQLLTTVQGSGNSFKPKKYSIYDTEPYHGMNYYRLSQTDYDGKTEVLDHLAVNKDPEGLSISSLYPNPANDLAHVSITTETSEQAQVQIIDMTGRLHYQSFYDLNEGTNVIYLPTNELPQSTYFFRVTTKRGTEYIRFEKVN
ncbi:MAG: T9SS type A sorting domain-containing protein [Flavobacteriales bacterium]|nr:T9SS type A sorting domain-containing protein [Flavobacteriales bacterium]